MAVDARRRDLAVAEALSGLPSVWLPGGGYAAHAWKVLAGTGLALALRSEEAMPEALDPLEARFEALSRAIRPVDITGDLTLSDDDLGMGPSVSRAPHRYLGLYSAEGVEFALHHYGIIEQVARLGYVDLRVLLDRAELGERFRLLGKSRDPEDLQEHLLARGQRAHRADRRPPGPRGRRAPARLVPRRLRRSLAVPLRRARATGPL